MTNKKCPLHNRENCTTEECEWYIPTKDKKGGCIIEYSIGGYVELSDLLWDIDRHPM